jgi:hypothetical protein
MRTVELCAGNHIPAAQVVSECFCAHGISVMNVFLALSLSVSHDNSAEFYNLFGMSTECVCKQNAGDTMPLFTAVKAWQDAVDIAEYSACCELRFQLVSRLFTCISLTSGLKYNLPRTQ